MRNSPVVVLIAVLLPAVALPVTLTGASVALPDIGRDLDASLASVQWVINGYNGTFASFMLANTARLVSETIAIAVVGAVLATTTGGRLAGAGFTSGPHTVLWWLAGLAAVAALVAAALLRRAPGRRPPDPAGVCRSGIQCRGRPGADTGRSAVSFVDAERIPGTRH